MEQRLEVAFHTSLDPATGIARYVRNLLVQLRERPPDVGVRPWACRPRPARPDWLPDSVRYRRHRVPGRIQQALVGRLGVSPQRLFALGRADVYHFTDPGAWRV